MTGVRVKRFIVVFGMVVWASAAFGDGFNADRVHIVRIPELGIYRVMIWYTHVAIAEYREAHVDFRNREEAIKVYRDLVVGADFFLGNIKESIHFHDEPVKNMPY